MGGGGERMEERRGVREEMEGEERDGEERGWEGRRGWKEEREWEGRGDGREERMGRRGMGWGGEGMEGAEERG